MVRRPPPCVWCCTALTRDLLIAGRSSSISRRDNIRLFTPKLKLQAFQEHRFAFLPLGDDGVAALRERYFFGKSF